MNWSRRIRSPSARVSLARKIAENDATVLITGESGTGKEVYARFIRDHSARADKPFIAINCAAIPENMLEATLFGYEKGAFTGALAAHAGKFEQAQGGTLLLDEISEMDLNLQAKILRVLQEREVERLGSSRTISLDVRLIATSNRDLPEEVRAGRFRADLYYRLNVMSLRLPALRERRGDILPLARRAIQACARGGQAAVTLSPAAERKLLRARLAGQCARADQHRAARGVARLGRPDRCGRPRTSMRRRHGRRPRRRVRRRVPGGGGRGRRARPRSQGARARADPGDAARHRAAAASSPRSASGSVPRTLRHKLQQLKAAGVTVPRLHDQEFAAASP